MEPVTCLVLVAFLGGAIGSFLNVVIYRLPRRESLSFPPSHCPSCNEPIRYYDNIPIVSYLILRGACRSCRARISPGYPLVEAITATFAVILFLQHGLSVPSLADFVLACILIAAMVIDYRFMIIPDRLNASGLALGIGFALLAGSSGLIRSIAGGAAGVSAMMLLYWFGKLLYHREGLGFGDVKLAGVMGVFLGPFWCAIACVIAIVLGGLWGIAQLLRRRATTGQEVPFGPFLSLGGFFVLFFKPELLYLIERYLALW